jgi:hypothetical protein
MPTLQSLVPFPKMRPRVRSPIFKDAILLTAKIEMMSEYNCIYGISTPCGLQPGDIKMVYGKDISFLVICGKEGRTSWFYFTKMDKKYYVPNIPKWTKKDAVKQVNEHLGFKITDKVCLGDIWKTRATYTLVSLQECFYDKWTWCRFASLGDSIHKVRMPGNKAAVEVSTLTLIPIR